jgi:hypothetical protein
MARSARAVWQLALVVTMETACHGLRRSDPDVLPEDAPIRCLFHMSEIAAIFQAPPASIELKDTRLVLNDRGGYLLKADSDCQTNPR